MIPYSAYHAGTTSPSTPAVKPASKQMPKPADPSRKTPAPMKKAAQVRRKATV